MTHKKIAVYLIKLYTNLSLKARAKAKQFDMDYETMPMTAKRFNEDILNIMMYILLKLKAQKG